MSDHAENKNTDNKNADKNLVGLVNTKNFTAEDAQKIVDSIKGNADNK